jgi:hypothetical protein
MKFKSAGNMAIVALHILPFTGHVYALDLDVDNQGKRLDHRDVYPSIISKAKWLITLPFE